MKKVLIFLLPSILVLMVGCGGNDNVPPPVPPQLNMNNPTDQQQLQSMQALANQTKSSCAASGTSSLIPMMMLISPNNGAGAPTGSGSPAAMGQFGMAQPSTGGVPVLPALSGDCSDSLINFLMMYATMKNGQYANCPETKPWFMSQIAGIVNRVGANLQAQGYQITPDVQQKLYSAAWQLVQRDVFSNPQFQGVKPAVCTGAGQFGLGC
jgi:hypothetical protein